MRSFYYLVNLAHDLCDTDRETAQEVLQRTPENIVVSMMGDEDKEVTRVDFNATIYTKMVVWDSLPCTEPPLLTRDMSEAELEEVVEKGHRFRTSPTTPSRWRPWFRYGYHSHIQDGSMNLLPGEVGP